MDDHARRVDDRRERRTKRFTETRRRIRFDARDDRVRVEPFAVRDRAPHARRGRAQRVDGGVGAELRFEHADRGAVP